MDQRVHQLGLSLANEIFITWKNDRGQSIFEDLSEALPPNVPKGKEAWFWVLQLDEWKAFINAQGRNNEGEFHSLLQIFFKDNRVKKFLNKCQKRYVFSGGVPVQSSYYEYDRGDELKPGVFTGHRPSRARKIMWHTADDPDKYCWRDVEVLWELKKNKMETDSRTSSAIWRSKPRI